ncbi:MAG: aminoacetone oxidase family FAD-binding enzyme, partial [Schwartzia succinivorans]|nr:aminoacetone oxidase family FAD-binding enzyme [Schwartzia succinivorans]
MSRVLVIGGGPAGMMAAIAAARNGAEVCLLEKTDRVGKKMRITGKGRCNITNAADMQEIIKNIPGNGAFLHSVFKAFDNQDVIQFFEDASVPTKVERGGRVFPVSDHADDCVNAMLHELHEAGVEVAVKSEVKHIVFHKQKVTGVQMKDGEILEADAVILAAGGASYPKTGSDGSGAELAKEAG